GKGQGLSDLALIAQSTRSIMTFDHACIDLLISQQIQDMLEFGDLPRYMGVIIFQEIVECSSRMRLPTTRHF
ncbi:hypothetical protein C2W62_38535, partial [Candidatus Entotheonella serta]